MSEALAGIRVLDLTDESAALGTRILADLGADVVLVEPPGGVRTRHRAPFLADRPGIERSCLHLYLNANKRSVVLDLDAAHDRARFLELVATADVVVDSVAPGRLDRLGLGHDALRAVRPRLIQASVTPFGLDGAWRDRLANDLVAGAAGGLMWLCGERSDPPNQGAARVSFTMAGLAVASGVTTALTQLRRQPDVGGVHLDISLQEATVMAAMQTATPSQWTWHGRVPGRPGLSNALRCADGGYVGLLVRPDRFESFLDWCDRSGVDHGMTPDDWEWSLLSAPRKNNPVVAATLALAQVHGRDAFAAGALEADIVCLPVLGFDDMADHEQYVVNDQFLEIEHPTLGETLGFVRSPVDAMADGVEIRPAPTLGQHTVEVLAPAPGRITSGDAPDGGLAGLGSPDGGLAGVDSPDGGVAGLGSPDPARALAGIRVVDFGWVLAAPIGTRLLASFGAEVIRLESESKPDSMRSQIGPDGTPDPDLGGLFNSVNAGKLSFTVDLTTDAGRGLVHDLIDTADVVVNNFRPGALARMGFGYDVLAARNPELVLLNLPGAHPTGPWSVRASMGNILMAASGFNLLMGFPGRRPRGVGVAYPDFTSPHLLVSTILAALRHRDRHGRGQELNLAQLSGMVSLLGVEWMHHRSTGRRPERAANRDPNFSPHGVYPAAGDDQWVAIAVETDHQWAALAELLGRPELTRDPRFAGHDVRKRNEDEIDEMVAGWTGGLDKWVAADRCQAVGIPAAAVADLHDTYERDPQLRHHYQTVHQPTAPDVDIPIDREITQYRGVDHRLQRAPLWGEHAEHVVRDLLGRTDDEYVQLVIDDVLR